MCKAFRESSSWTFPTSYDLDGTGVSTPILMSYEGGHQVFPEIIPCARAKLEDCGAFA